MLSRFACFALAPLALMCVGVGCQRPALPPNLAPGHVLVYRTADGWEMDLRRYPNDGPPVMLVHGMGANHYNWDYRDDVSFAYYLHQQGWDVWVPVLRGDMGARPPEGVAEHDYTFDDHALYDLPAATSAVLAATGHDRLYWVGHSMGGMLLYTSLSILPERIAAGVAIGAPASFEEQRGIHRLARTGGWLVPKEGQLHNHAFYRVARIFGERNPMYTVLANKDNLDWPTTRGLARAALEDMSRPTVRQVHTWLREGELTDLSGTPWVRPMTEPVPVLVLTGSADRVALPHNVEAACAVYADCEFRLLGRETGLSTDYGHIDTVVGVAAREEVYPIIHQFLASHLPDGVSLGEPEDDEWSPVVEVETWPESHNPPKKVWSADSFAR